ncbi:MAG: hypothetical protein JW861_13900 [Bacteroidales bacterium]|nr:hypothetical protein [Bacteroidales bacterium]
MEHREVFTRKRHMVPYVFRIVGWVIGGIILAVVLAFLFGYFVMLLWNWIMPALFGLPEIGYWMAFGIIILARLIFGGFGHGNHDKNDHDKHFRHKTTGTFSNKSGNWKYYDDFWHEEGEKAFRIYVETRESEKKGE